jgi:hypothetical protein
MAKKPSLLEEVKAGLPTRKGFAPWYETLPADLRDEIEEIRRMWHTGTLTTTKTALGMQLSKSLNSRGVTIGHSGVIKWLEKA